MLQGGYDTADVRISLGIDQTRIAVARAAPNAWTILPIPFIEHHSKRRVKRIQPEAHEIIALLLNARLVTERGIRKCTTAVRLSGIFSDFAVHMVNAFRVGVVRLELTVRD